MDQHGYFRVATATPPVHLADPSANAAEVIALLAQAEGQHCDLVVFPELNLTGYTCGDLFLQSTLIDAAWRALLSIQQASLEVCGGVIVVGLPIEHVGRLYNVAAVVQQGRILGLVPKSHLPNYNEFYERRWFCPGRGDEPAEHRSIPFGRDLLFETTGSNPVAIGVEICEDLWMPIPPSSRQALAGANVLVNLSASNELIGKADWRRTLVTSQSGRCLAAYVYSSAGNGESTTDVVFAGHALIAENGALLAERRPFANEPLLIADLDIARLHHERRRINTFHDNSAFAPGPSCRRLSFNRVDVPIETLRRPIDPHPFVPSQQSRLSERCEEIFHTQTAALRRRLEAARVDRVHLGISGGLDSTLALLVACKTFDQMQRPRSQIVGVTMPGFGTTDRTKANADRLMRELGIGARTIEIRGLCLDTMRSMGHRPFGIDLTGLTVDEFSARLQQLPAAHRADLIFENVQARQRTTLLMDLGFVVGTGDLSELALGWCTYNGDHMSMYNPNIGVPKTLVRFLVRWAADHEFHGAAATLLHDIADTIISPELLPLGIDQAPQSTESTIGPYELHDFFLYQLIRFGDPPSKIFRLATQARFDQPYEPTAIKHWLGVFLRRFFMSQYKRSALPDGPKVGSIALSPRGDWRMPSDAAVTAWLAELDSLPK